MTKVGYKKLAVLNRCVFSLDLNVACDELDWILTGTEFRCFTQHCWWGGTEGLDVYRER